MDKYSNLCEKTIKELKKKKQLENRQKEREIYCYFYERKTKRLRHIKNMRGKGH